MIYVLENYNHISQQLVYRASTEWTSNKSYWLEERKEAEGGRAEESSATGDRRQAAISRMPNVDSPGSGSLLGSILSTLLKKWSNNVWIVACFFLFTDEMVALDCILNRCFNICVPFYIGVLGLKI